eukprot:3213-Heterococcus_DN1.PRE.1
MKATAGFVVQCKCDVKKIPKQVTSHFNLELPHGAAMVRAVLQSAVVASLVASIGYACTTIAVGKLASTDGSTMATHNADCLDCDFRIGKVPAKDWPEGALRPIVKFRAEFPRT